MNQCQSRSQANRIEDAVMSIPTTITNITTINGQAVALSPCTILLAAPIHAHRIIIGRFHLLLLIHLQALSGSELLCNDFAAGEAEGVKGWLLNVEGRKSGD